jgi:spore maturation protein SpmB
MRRAITKGRLAAAVAVIVLAAFGVLPFLLAMPEPMVKALGWPDAAIGWADLLRLARP